MRKKMVLGSLGFAGGLLLASLSVQAFDPAAYFDENCSSCHTVGQGDGVGPDLKEVMERRKKEWIIPFIQSSQDVIKSGDPVANELFNKFQQIKMPDQDLSAEEITALLDFVMKGGPAEVPIEDKPASASTPADITRGHDLFTGKIRFTEGGPACLSCHTVNGVGLLGGGTLGLNLTQAYSKYEDKGLSQSLRKPGFRIMKEIYGEKPLTDDEAFALKAFLYRADQSGIPGRDFRKKFLFLGIGGTTLMLGITDFIWRNRRRKSAKPWRNE